RAAPASEPDSATARTYRSSSQSKLAMMGSRASPATGGQRRGGLSPAARLSPAGDDLEHLHAFGKRYQELGIAFQMADATRILAGVAGHCLDALPVGDRDELGLARPILAQHLNPERPLCQGPDAVLVKVGRAGVGI